jgi:hypothetical protein
MHLCLFYSYSLRSGTTAPLCVVDGPGLGVPSAACADPNNPTTVFCCDERKVYRIQSGTFASALTYTFHNSCRCVWRSSAAGAVDRIAGGALTHADGSALSAKFAGLLGMLIASDSRRIWLADCGAHRIRCLTWGESQWTVSTVAGNGDDDKICDGPALQVGLGTVYGLAFDTRTAVPQSTMFVAENDGLRRLEAKFVPRALM